MKQINDNQIKALLETIWNEGIKTTTYQAINNMFTTLPNIEDKPVEKNKDK